MSQPEISMAQKFAMLPKDERDKILESMTPKQLADLSYDWNWWARPKQLKCFEDGDWSTFMYLCGRGFGKALSLDTEIPTPDGWTTMGDIKVGDRLFDEGGNICTVTYATKVMKNRPCFEVVFSDNTIVVADAEHQWNTLAKDERRNPESLGTTRTTLEIKETLTIGDRKESNHAIRVCEPVKYKKKKP